MTDTTDEDASDEGEDESESEAEDAQMTPETGAMTQRPAHLRDDAAPEHGARDADEDDEDEGDGSA